MLLIFFHVYSKWTWNMLSSYADGQSRAVIRPAQTGWWLKTSIGELDQFRVSVCSTACLVILYAFMIVLHLYIFVAGLFGCVSYHYVYRRLCMLPPLSNVKHLLDLPSPAALTVTPKALNLRLYFTVVIWAYILLQEKVEIITEYVMVTLC